MLFHWLRHHPMGRKRFLSAPWLSQALMSPITGATLYFQLNNANVLAYNGSALPTHSHHMSPVALISSGSNTVYKSSRSGKISSYTGIFLDTFLSDCPLAQAVDNVISTGIPVPHAQQKSPPQEDMTHF